MSRFLLASSLVAALVTYAFADRRFAAPPPATPPTAGEVAPHDQLMEPIVMDRAAVRAKLAEARAANVARFRAYQKAGVFPSNTFQGNKLNVWRDADGHLCAAATIINASGKADLVNRVAEQTNFIRLADVKQGPLMDWILTSGLTQEEIAAIQEPFMPVVDEPGVVDPQLRAREDARLRATYKRVDAQIAKATQKSLDIAVDRLMSHQDLAWALVNS